MLETLTTTSLSPTVTSTLNTYDVSNETLTTISSTLSTSLTLSMHPNYVYYYYLCDQYINSLSDTELAKIDQMLDEKIDSSKKLVLK